MALLGVFLSTILVSFGLTLLVAGLFGARFGQGKSRSVGFVLSLVALLLLALFAALTWELVPGIPPAFEPHVIGQSMLAVVAATLGFALALGMFVASVMRS